MQLDFASLAPVGAYVGWLAARGRGGMANTRTCDSVEMQHP